MFETLQKSDLVTRFEVAFNRIHVKLREIAKKNQGYAPYSEVLGISRKLHNSVRYNYGLLKQFGYLRNALVHEKLNQSYYIAEPHEEVVKEIERICLLINQPPSALSIASRPVTRFQPNTSLLEILEVMGQKGYSQIPIYEYEGFIGLVTEGGIVKWMARNRIDYLVSIEEVTAMTILQYEKSHNVAFLPRAGSIYDIEDVFEESFDRNEKLEALIITESGSKTQKPIGIVTSWDLVQIDHTTVSLVSQV